MLGIFLNDRALASLARRPRVQSPALENNNSIIKIDKDNRKLNSMSFLIAREFECAACYYNLAKNIVVRFSSELWGQIDAMRRPTILSSFR